MDQRALGRFLLLVHFYNLLNVELHELERVFLRDLGTHVLPDLVYDVAHDDLNVVLENREVADQLTAQLLVRLLPALADNVLVGEPLLLLKETLKEGENLPKGAVATDLLQHVLNA